MHAASRPNALRETAFDEVFDSQRTFRTLLDCMSRPGRVSALPPLRYEGTPEGLNPHVLSVLKTLCDHRVSFAVADPRPQWVGYLAMNTAAPRRTPGDADYVVFPGALYNPSFAAVKKGTLEVPEASATALVCVERIEAEADGVAAGSGCTLLLSGPGTRGLARLAVRGLDRRYPEALAAANALHPLGVDTILLDQDGRVSCIPRSSKVEVS